jgi:hypothetical protein
VIASAALQVAVYQRLNGNVGTGVAVFDEVPSGTAYPYVVIGETTERPWLTHTEDGSEETVLIHVWSDAKGAMEAKTILAAINARLHRVNLTLTGGAVAQLVRVFKDVFREPTDVPGETLRHGVIRFRAFISI